MGTDMYVGSLLSLRNQSALQTLGITHIVSVLKFDFHEVEGWEHYEHLNIGVDDVEEEALLGDFERTGAFIEEALRSGKAGRPGRVLIHWWVPALLSHVIVFVMSKQR